MLHIRQDQSSRSGMLSSGIGGCGVIVGRQWAVFGGGPYKRVWHAAIVKDIGLAISSVASG
jgi:hypothetical protein